MTLPTERDEIEIFIQGEGISSITLVRVRLTSKIAEIVEVARKHGLSSPEDTEVFVLLEDGDQALSLDETLEVAGLAARSRVHIHRLLWAEVTVNFNDDQRKTTFPPSATVALVKKWAVGKEGFDMSDVDATEHLLQVCGSTARPDEDVHIGTLLKTPDWTICFDLVPKQRVEG